MNIPSLQAGPFRPAWWCRNGHLQTLWPYFFRMRPRPRYRRQRRELPDGDFIDLDWYGSPDASRPLVVILHGLQGCSHSHYARGLVTALDRAGLAAVVMHQRGCSGEPNRLARTYHAGASEDLDLVLAGLASDRRRGPLFVAGYSLGGSILLNWLGRDRPGQQWIRAAAAVSVPYVLQESADRLARGPSRIYQRRLLSQMRLALTRKFAHMPCPLDLSRLDRLDTFTRYDDAVTAPLHGFDGVEDYYGRCSARQYLPNIGTPTLLVHARDDPLMTERVIPVPADLGPGVTLELFDHGGHCGFVAGGSPLRPLYWLDRRLPAHFRQYLGDAGAARSPMQ
jgi:predicted alpha/beta-fold hydrolase